MRRNQGKIWRRAAAVALLALASGFGTITVHATPVSALSQTIAVANLPPEGQSMMRLIYLGGPFKHGKDGAVFGNRVRILPSAQRGYYREYTVMTPGERSRGARRIVCGGQQPAAPSACFYTDDHYASFRQIVR